VTDAEDNTLRAENATLRAVLAELLAAKDAYEKGLTEDEEEALFQHCEKTLAAARRLLVTTTPRIKDNKCL
jgi:hypothetical protein